MMRSTCWATARPPVLVLLACGLSTSAEAQNAACALENPVYAAAGVTATFQIDVNCGASKSGRPYPVGQPLVVGLTLYGPKEVSAKPESHPVQYGKGTRQTIEKANAGKKERGYVRDQHSGVYDFALKDVVVARDTKTLVVKFEAPLRDVERYSFMLFAVWPKSQVADCDRKDKYARSGCARYGYVVGDETVGATDFFPGIEITDFVHPAGDWTSERWMVERFR